MHRFKKKILSFDRKSICSNLCWCTKINMRLLIFASFVDTSKLALTSELAFLFAQLRRPIFSVSALSNSWTISEVTFNFFQFKSIRAKTQSLRCRATVCSVYGFLFLTSLIYKNLHCLANAGTLKLILFRSFPLNHLIKLRNITLVIIEI